MPPRPCVFLDRDGTLNEQIVRDGLPYPPYGYNDFRLFPGVAAGCRALCEAGFVLVVATNQPDVERGTQTKEAVEAMHTLLRSQIPDIERIEVCYDPGPAPTRRRKPEPGMLLDAAKALDLDLTRSWMVGDRWRDVDCGQRAGVRTVLIDFGYAEALREQPDIVVHSFPEAVAAILREPAVRPTTRA